MKGPNSKSCRFSYSCCDLTAHAHYLLEISLRLQCDIIWVPWVWDTGISAERSQNFYQAGITFEIGFFRKALHTCTHVREATELPAQSGRVSWARTSETPCEWRWGRCRGCTEVRWDRHGRLAHTALESEWGQTMTWWQQSSSLFLIAHMFLKPNTTDFNVWRP